MSNMENKEVTKYKVDNEKFCSRVVTWKDLAEAGKGREDNIAYFKLPKPMESCGQEYNDFFFVKLDNGELAVVFIKNVETKNGKKPMFALPDPRMDEFVKKIVDA